MRAFKVRPERVQTTSQDVPGSVFVAVHDVAAIAFHRAFIQWHVMNLTAFGTGLAARLEATDKGHFDAAQFGLVLNHPAQRAETSIADRTGELAIPDHAFDVQVFQTDDLVVSGQSVRQLVQYSLPLVADALVQLGDRELGSRSAVRSFLLARQAALLSLQRLQVPLQCVVRGEYGTVRCNRQRLDAEIDADRFMLRRVRIVVVGLDEDGSIKLSSALTDRDLVQSAGETQPLAHLDARLQLLDPQLPAIHIELGRLAQGEAVADAFLLEGRESWLLAKLDAAEEVLESVVQVVNCVAGNAARHFVVPGECRTDDLDVMLVCRCLRPLHILLAEVLQQPVVAMTTRPTSAGQIVRLFCGRAQFNLVLSSIIVIPELTSLYILLNHLY